MPKTNSANLEKPDIPRVALKLSEVAFSLGISEASVRRLIARGALRPCRGLRHILIAADEIARFLSDNKTH